MWQKTAVSDNTKVLYSRGIVKDSKVKRKLVVEETKLLSITQKAEELKGWEDAHMNLTEFSMASGGLVKTITKLLSIVQIEVWLVTLSTKKHFSRTFSFAVTDITCLLFV